MWPAEQCRNLNDYTSEFVFGALGIRLWGGSFLTCRALVRDRVYVKNQEDQVLDSHIDPPSFLSAQFTDCQPISNDLGTNWEHLKNI